jgi:hypothetical protein
MSEEESTLVIELQGLTKKNATKVLEAVRATLEALREECRVSDGKRGVPRPLCHGFLFKESPIYDPLPYSEWWDESGGTIFDLITLELARQGCSKEDIDLIIAHARATD